MISFFKSDVPFTGIDKMYLSPYATVQILHSSEYCHGLIDILGVKGVYTSTVIKGAAQFFRQYVSFLAPRYAQDLF